MGGFPPLWSEWKGKYRDTVRDFHRSEPGKIGDFTSRLAGSSDLYQHTGRTPIASINFVTAHDGFTLKDLVSYNDRHNEANGEGGTDGESHNRSWNTGVEGPTEDTAVRDLRLRRAKNLMATLLLSQGVPMILHGDEMGRTQNGNNNTYCQDDEISWMDWELDAYEMDMLWFTQSVISLRRDHPIFRRRRFLQGAAQDTADSSLPDVEWLGTDGAPMTDEDWNDAQNKCLTMFLNGSAIPEPNLRGERIVDDSALVLFNASGNPVDFALPPADHGREWRVELGTGDTIDIGQSLEAGTTLERPGHSLLILTRPPMTEGDEQATEQDGSRTTRA